MLLWQGVRPDILTQALRLARETGTDGTTAIIRGGLMSEEAYYRALARALDRPFLADDLPLDPSTRFPESLLAGAAPLRPEEPNAVVLAPEGRAVAALLRHGLHPGRPAAITSPTRLRQAVMRMRTAGAALYGAETLDRNAPEWAYRPGISSGHGLAVGLAVACVPLLWDASLLIQAVVASGLNLLFLSMTVFRLAAALVPPPTMPAVPRAADSDLPVYTVLVALHREAAVVPRLLAALARLDYPRPKLDVKLILEEDDPQTAAALAAAGLPAWIEVLVAPAGEPRTKPRALNIALPLARGTYLAVYDAEDVPDPGQLRRAAAIFASSSTRIACLQGRLVVDNAADSWLTRCFALEYAALFDVLIPALTAWRLPVPLGGTTTHFRTPVLRSLHGWDAWNVTEDADLGLRLALAGYQVGDLPLSTFEEAPSRLRPWLRQRTRWMKGFLQTAITHSRHPLATARALGAVETLAAIALIPGTVISALLFYPLMLAVAAWRFLLGPIHAETSFWANLAAALGIEVLVVGMAALALPAALGCLRRGWPNLLPWIALLPLYYGLVSVAAWLGLAELLRAPSRWNKTEHGLARTSRSGALAPPPVRAGGPRPRRPRRPAASG